MKHCCCFMAWMPLLAWASLSSCGYIGDPLPPSLEIPVAVTDLRAAQLGSKLTIQYSPALKTTEGLVLKRVVDTELRLGPLSTSGAFNIDQWAASATRFEVPISEDPVVKMEIPAVEWAGKDVLIAVRSRGAKQRFSAWSNLLVIPVVAELKAPAQLTAVAQVDGVMIRWQPVNSAEYRILRGAAEIAKTTAAEFLDTTAEFGIQQSYQVQAFRKLNAKQMAESPLSDTVAILPKDTFPPAVPAGLQLIPGVASIEITWQRNVEPDFKFYKIWRSEGDGEFKLLMDAVTQLTYSDRTAVRGKRYRYAISAIDNLGNESGKSKSEELTLPE